MSMEEGGDLEVKRLQQGYRRFQAVRAGTYRPARYAGVITWAMFAALAGVWGASFLFIKISLEVLDPLTVVALRLTLGALLVWTVALVNGADLASIPWGTMFLMGLVNNALPFTLITWGELYIPSGLASLVNGSVPIFAAILSHFFLQEESLSLRQWGGIFIGFLGLVLLFLPDLTHALRGWQSWWSVWGELAITLAAFCYGLSTVYARKALRGHSPYLMAASQLTMAALILWPLALLFGQGVPTSALTPRALLAVGWLGFASSGLAYLLYYTLIKRMGATQLTMVTYVIPIVGLVLGVIVLGETVGVLVLVALVLILTSIVIVKRGG